MGIVKEIIGIVTVGYRGTSVYTGTEFQDRLSWDVKSKGRRMVLLCHCEKESWCICIFFMHRLSEKTWETGWLRGGAQGDK